MNAGFHRLAETLRQSTGIVIDPTKWFALEARLSSIAVARCHGDITAMLDSVRPGQKSDLLDEIVDAIATNETFFFRDRSPFRLLAGEILSHLLTARAEQREIRIWCNACSTGQEPYSVAMTLDQAGQKLAGWRVALHASDISRTAVAAAREGVYNQFEAQRGTPTNFLLKYFTREGDNWRISEQLRSKVRFSLFNLLSPFNEHRLYDVIFCRNVLIYFDVETRRDILARLAKAIRPDGFLVLGATETIASGDPNWITWSANPLALVRTDGPFAPRS